MAKCAECGKCRCECECPTAIAKAASEVTSAAMAESVRRIVQAVRAASPVIRTTTRIER